MEEAPSVSEIEPQVMTEVREEVGAVGRIVLFSGEL